MKVLDFLLYNFIRISWTSDLAKAVWHPRFNQITSNISEIELVAIKENLKKCAYFKISAEQVSSFHAKLNRYGLVFVELNFNSDPEVVSVLVGNDLAELDFFNRAWKDNNHSILQTMLGTPNCCQEFLQYVWIKLERNDPTWEMACTKGLDDLANKIKLPTNPLTNMFLHRLGLKYLHHIPCRMNCSDSITQAKKIHQIGKDLGLNHEMNWLTEILSWPIEWSALHGIAETKTPLFKFINETDATPFKYSIEYAGSQYPLEGARGLSFPYNFRI